MNKRIDPAMGNLGYDLIENQFYPTPEWVIDGLIRVAVGHKLLTIENQIWEPACGEGHLSKVLIKRGFDVYSSDLIYRGFSSNLLDFLTATECHGDTIITNPPYGKLAEQFIRKAAELMRPVGGKVFMLLRNEYDSASTRRDLFGDNSRFAAKLTLTSRPKWIANSTGSPRHNYAWFYWDFSKFHGLPSTLYIHR